MADSIPRDRAEPSTLVPSSWFGAYVFDLDGTIYLGDELLPGAGQLVTALRKARLPVRFLSNNPTRDPAAYADKLTRLGLPAATDEIVNTLVVTTRWLLREMPDAVVFPIGAPALEQALVSAGLKVSEDPAEIDVVLASYDQALSYRKLQIAFDALWFHGRARLLATNPDRYCPLPGGRGEPDTAATVAAIEAATEVPCERTFGKPDPAMLEIALDGLGVAPADVLMVGDRLHTDIALAHAAGASSGLVLTGDSGLRDLDATPAAQRPDFVLERIDELLPDHDGS